MPYQQTKSFNPIYQLPRNHHQSQNQNNQSKTPENSNFYNNKTTFINTPQPTKTTIDLAEIRIFMNKK